MFNLFLVNSLLLEPHIENATSTGRVKILVTRDLEVKDLNPIILDITDITITSCRLDRTEQHDDDVEGLDFTCEYGKNNESYVITVKDTKHRPTNVSLTLEFVSKLTDTLQGFYKGSFYNEDTKTDSWFASTQFSPIDCRRAFPSFDRPSFKATFQMSLIRPIDKKTYLNNMPVESTE